MDIRRYSVEIQCVGPNYAVDAEVIDFLQDVMDRWMGVPGVLGVGMGIQGPQDTPETQKGGTRSDDAAISSDSHFPNFRRGDDG